MNVIHAKYNLFWRLVGPPFGAAMAVVFAAWLLPELVAERDWVRLFLVAVPGVLVGVYCTVTAFRYRLSVTEDYVEARDIRTRRILYSEAKKIRVWRRMVELYTDSTRIAVHSGIENREEVVRAILDRVSDVPGVRVEGDDKAIATYWEPVARNKR